MLEMKGQSYSVQLHLTKLRYNNNNNNLKDYFPSVATTVCRYCLYETLTEFVCCEVLHSTLIGSHRVYSHHLVVVCGHNSQSSQLNREWEVGSSEVVITLSLLVEGGQ